MATRPPQIVTLEKGVENAAALNVVMTADENTNATDSEGGVLPSLRKLYKTITNWFGTADQLLDRADDALAAATAVGRIYTSNAAAQADAGLSVGDAYTLVFGEGEDAVFQFFRKDSASSSSALSGQYPSLVALQKAIAINTVLLQPTLDAMDGSAFAITDGQNRIAFRIRTDGTTDVTDLTAFDVTADMLGTESNKMSETASTSGLAVVDGAGNLGFLVDSNGAYAPTALADVQTAGKFYARGSINGTRFTPKFAWDYFHIISYGQSLALGTRALPLQSTAPKYDSLMFSAGVLPEAYSSPTPYASFAPMVETDVTTGFDTDRFNIDFPGETSLSGTCQAIKQLIEQENGIKYTDQHFRLIGSAAGRGGTSIANLLRGSDAFNRMVTHVSSAKALATAQGRSYGCGAITFAQGEQDAAMAYETYLTYIKLFFTQANEDIKAITGQTEDVQFFLYQTAEMLPGVFMAPVAQLQASIDMSNVHIATPIYQLQTTPLGDNVHLSGPSSKIMGASFGAAIKRVCIDGADAPSMRPVGFSAVGNAAYVNLSIANTGVMVDGLNSTTKFGGLLAGYGFKVYNGSGTPVGITSVSFPQHDRIRILAASPITTGYRLTYGEVGGNVRDNDGSLFVFDPEGLNHPLHNWLVSFSHTF